MMHGKSVYLIALFVAIVGFVASQSHPDLSEKFAIKANLSHNLIVGSRLAGDRLVLKQNIVKTTWWLQVSRVEQTFNVSRYEKITQVKALDQEIDGNGATPSLLYGGPSFNNVTLRFESKRSHDINFVVEIYARPY